MEKEKKAKYVQCIGRRKESVAKVRMYANKKGKFTVNDVKIEEYFTVPRVLNLAKSPLAFYKSDAEISVKVSGGGQTAQAESIRLGISRAIVKDKPEARPELKKAGYLKRDPRVKERRKFGLAGKARKGSQWSKR